MLSQAVVRLNKFKDTAPNSQRQAGFSKRNLDLLHNALLHSWSAGCSKHFLAVMQPNAFSAARRSDRHQLHA